MVARSASVCLTPWNEPITRPNCTRSLAKATAWSNIACAAPSVSAASMTRPASSTRVRAATGSLAALEHDRRRVLERDVEQRPGAVEARHQVARTPSRVHGDERGPAVGEIDQHVRRAAAVEHALHPAREPLAVEGHAGRAGLADGAGEAHGDAHLAGGDPAAAIPAAGPRCRSPCSASGAITRLAGERAGRRVIAEALGGHGRIENAEPRAAVPLRHGEPGNALRDEAGPQLGVVAVAGRGDGAAALHRQAVGEEAPQRGLQHLLLLGEGELHGSGPRRWRTAFGSRGRPRPRSPMMFFWMLVEPPPIMRPMSYMLSMCQAVASSVSAASSLAS